MNKMKNLRLLYQYYLFNKDQQQVHKDQQQVYKDQLQVLILVMKTVSLAMSTVHRVSTLEEQYSMHSGRTVLYADLYVQTNNEHWAMTPETHKYAAAAGSFVL